VYINDDARIVSSDYVTADGVIHYIDKVLTPYDLKDQKAIPSKVGYGCMPLSRHFDPKLLTDTWCAYIFHMGGLSGNQTYDPGVASSVLYQLINREMGTLFLYYIGLRVLPFVDTSHNLLPK
jgi:hypothetical protein